MWQEKSIHPHHSMKMKTNITGTEVSFIQMNKWEIHIIMWLSVLKCEANENSVQYEYK